MQDELSELFHVFHMYPELSFEEKETARRISLYLKELGYTVNEGVGRTGVTARLEGYQPGPNIAIRADIDALPITEETGLPHSSTIPGRMHACGHDVHTTCALGAARLLAENRSSIRGSITMIFQPAEEINLGAKEMVRERVLEKNGIDMIFGLHNHPEIPVGKIALKEGPLMAAVDRIEITITGKGGHGGLPHRDKDPIVASAAMIMNLQTIVSRNINPLDSAVISLGTINGGTRNNVIPDRVEMTGTVRTFTPEVRNSMEEQIRRIVENTAATLMCRGELKYIYELPAVINPPIPKRIVEKAVRAVAGKDAIVTPTPSTGGEDFSIYQEKVTGCFFWLGVGNPEKGAVHPWHSPRFRVDERALPLGAGVLANSVLLAMDQERSDGEVKG
jgi:amidohydrolase